MSKFLPLLLGFLATASLSANESKPGIVLKNDRLALGFDENYTLTSLRDPIAEHEFLQSKGKHPALWALELRTAEGATLHLSSRTESTRHLKRLAKGTEISFVWNDLVHEGKPLGISVNVTVTLSKESDRSYWTIAVDNKSALTLQHVQFPILPGISREGQPNAAIPRHNWGQLEKGVTYTRGSYPSCIWPMQFLALLEEKTGLYLAYEDPRAIFKFFDLKPGEYFHFTSFAENSTLPGNDFASPGPVAIGVSGSNWWNAAKMFRQWALKQEWTRRGPLSEESNVPTLAKNVGIWFNEVYNTEDPEAQLEAYRKAVRYFGLPFASQFYTWHTPAFDTGYPDYFPPREGFNNLISELRRMGGLVSPYVNGRLQDMNIASTEAAKPFAVKKTDGTPSVEDYGSGATLAVMCPATQYWQDVMVQTAEKLVTGSNVNGIYYDQIAAAEAVMCFDPSHGHPTGGGSHWVDGYRKMLTRTKTIRTQDGQPLFVASENNTDCYMDTVDAFLTWTPRHPDEIPLLTAVYSGYALYFGSNAQVPDDDFASFAMYVGRDILWGTQPGWMPLESTPERDAYLRAVAQTRYAARKFFQFGELLGEVTPDQPPAKVKGEWRNIDRVENVFYDVEIDAVMTTLWRSPEGTLGLAMANFSAQPQPLSYTLNPALYGFELPKKHHWTAASIHLSGTVPLEDAVYEKTIIRQETLQPWEFRVIEFTPIKRSKK